VARASTFSLSPVRQASLVLGKLFANQVTEKESKNKHSITLGKNKLRASCPTGKLEFKYFLSRDN